MKRAYLLIVRELRIDSVNCRLGLVRRDVPSYDRLKISLAISHQKHLRCCRQLFEHLLLNRFGSNVMT